MTDLEREQDIYRILSFVVEQSTEGIAMVDLDGNLTYVNEAFAAMHGYSPGELAGKHLSIFHTPEQMPAVEEANLQLKNTGKFSGEIWHVRRDGTAFPTLMNNYVIRDEGGSEIGIIGTLRDITGRKRIEEALRESEKRFKQVAEHAREWIWEVDADGLCTYASPAVEKILGYTPEEIVGRKHFYDLFHHEEREDIKKVSFEVFAQQKPFRRFINRNVHKNGTEVVLETSGVPILDENGKFLGYRGTDTDITERKKAAEALQKSEEKWRSLVMNAPEVIMIVGLDGTIEYINRIVPGISDSIEKAVGSNLYDYMPVEYHDTVNKTFKQVIETGKVGWYDTEVSKQEGGTRWYHMRVGPFKQRGRITSLMIIATDITVRKSTEDELEQYRTRLEEIVEKRTGELKRVNEDLLLEITGRKKIEKELRDSEERLKEQKEALEEKNVALREILEQLGVEKKKFKDDIVANIENLVIPVLRKLETEEGQFKQEYLILLKRNLEELATSFGSRLAEPRLRLTPREIEVCDMIKTGLNTKDIARLLHISKKTVEKHRDNIRRKLDITNRGINLSTYLQAL